MGFYDDLATTATGLLTNYGASLTFTRATQGAYNPATGAASETSTTYTLRCVVDTYSLAEIDGGRVRSTDRKVLAQAGGTVPAIGDTVAIDGASGRIEAVMPTQPAGTAVMYELQVRL